MFIFFFYRIVNGTLTIIWTYSATSLLFNINHHWPVKRPPGRPKGKCMFQVRMRDRKYTHSLRKMWQPSHHNKTTCTEVLDWRKDIQTFFNFLFYAFFVRKIELYCLLNHHFRSWCYLPLFFMCDLSCCSSESFVLFV